MPTNMAMCCASLIRVPAVLPQLIDFGGELVDPLVALAQ
jgi:hypothetical protein